MVGYRARATRLPRSHYSRHNRPRRQTRRQESPLVFSKPPSSLGSGVAIARLFPVGTNVAVWSNSPELPVKCRTWPSGLVEIRHVGAMSGTAGTLVDTSYGRRGPTREPGK